jgi:hypothetical protein
MNDSDETNDAAASGATARWAAPSTAKERTAVQRAVDRLLDALAPERIVARSASPPVPIERYRTRRGCILQAPTAAVSVSWFPDAAQDGATGELHIVAWRGVLSQPGSARRTPGAAIVRELALRPVDCGTDAWEWRATDGSLHDLQAVVALCRELLEAQTAGETGEDRS